METELFNPRINSWNDHFELSHEGPEIRPKTASGRVTMKQLQMNRDRVLRIRLAELGVETTSDKAVAKSFVVMVVAGVRETRRLCELEPYPRRCRMH